MPDEDQTATANDQDDPSVELRHCSQCGKEATLLSPKTGACLRCAFSVLGPAVEAATAGTQVFNDAARGLCNELPPEAALAEEDHG